MRKHQALNLFRDVCKPCAGLVRNFYTVLLKNTTPMEQDLQNEEARKKLKELAEDVRICMFASTDSNDDKYGRPMSTIQVDDDGSIWFFTKEDNKITNEAK